MARGYTTAGIVEKHTGAALTDAQADGFDFVLEAVEAFIDGETGSAWLTGPVTNELHGPPLDSPRVRLRQRPVTAITAVSGRSSWNGAPSPFTDAVDYTLIDARAGVLYVPNFPYWHSVSVTYTPDARLPWTINRAATLLVAAMLPGAGGGDVDPATVKSYSVGGDLSVTFRDAVASAADNPDVRRLLRQHRHSLVA